MMMVAGTVAAMEIAEAFMLAKKAGKDQEDLF